MLALDAKAFAEDPEAFIGDVLKGAYDMSPLGVFLNNLSGGELGSDEICAQLDPEIINCKPYDGADGVPEGAVMIGSHGRRYIRKNKEWIRETAPAPKRNFNNWEQNRDALELFNQSNGTGHYPPALLQKSYGNTSVQAALPMIISNGSVPIGPMIIRQPRQEFKAR